MLTDGERERGRPKERWIDFVINNIMKEKGVFYRMTTGQYQKKKNILRLS